MRRYGLLLGIALVLASNALVLIGVAWNRWGTPFQTIELTERELPLVSRDEDDSSIRLQLQWEPRFTSIRRRQPAWNSNFDGAKLRELGFDCPHPADVREPYPVPLPRLLFVALEFDGPAREQWLQEQRRKAEAELVKPVHPQPSRLPADGGADSPGEGTRLFVVDAARSFEELQTRYPDRRRHLIVHAVIRAVLQKDPGPGAAAPPRWSGIVSDVISGVIHIPRPYSSQLAPFRPAPGKAPRYAVTLRYGRRFEPWVTDVRLLSGESNP